MAHLSRRRLLLFELSPCQSTNLRRLSDPSPTPTPTHSETPVVDQTHTDSEDLLAAATARKRDSSASCPGWSMGSLFDKCPPSPSPVCSSSPAESPTSSRRMFFSPVSTDVPSGLPLRYQSSSIRSYDDLKFTTPREEVMKKHNKLRSHCLDDLSQARKSMVLELDRRLKNTNPNKPASMPASNKRKSVKKSQEGIDESDHQKALLARKGHPSSTNIDHQCRLSSASDCSGHESADSDVESIIDEHRRSLVALSSRARGSHPYISVAEIKRMEIHNKLIAYREAMTQKLMNNLRKKEAQIFEWETKRTTKARMKLMELQTKLEKKHDKGFEEMRKSIAGVHTKAQRERLKERAFTMKKIQIVDTVGKLPWKIFLC
ncbi:hypothetical protein QJS04_geneDACA012447 [Acorus gramineus]|uniref:Remorin C-terminal domain-containing protein n=1 Tax=Acorus gramineus TaxID=55184 RepID=A0AAV9B7L6_ACOGR|nr:hypothetical protein QJS04_geneDACA012447 [Acorus gramineus]